MNAPVDMPSAGPRPVPDQDTEAFWEAVERRRLLVPRCARCGRWIWQPRPLCPRCHAPDPEWTEVSGAGRVASWTVLHPPVLPAFSEQVPFVVLLVELAEGIRMVGQLVDGDGEVLRTDGSEEDLAMGSAVALRWRRQGDLTLPGWTLDVDGPNAAKE